jgi:hypothetical protein
MLRGTTVNGSGSTIWAASPTSRLELRTIAMFRYNVVEDVLAATAKVF